MTIKEEKEIQSIIFSFKAILKDNNLSEDKEDIFKRDKARLSGLLKESEAKKIKRKATK